MMEGGEGGAEMRREMGEIILKKHPTLHLPSLPLTALYRACHFHQEILQMISAGSL